MNQIIIQIENGKLRGRVAKDYLGGTYYSFQGIPYAKPPIGELRFKAPLPPISWNGIKDATKEGSRSVSRHEANGSIIGSEDCLFLNVYTPTLPKLMKETEINKLKPVLFWIHGGMCVFGSGSTELYGPEYLMTEDIILVTINYRLGVLGFLNLEETSLGVPGNAALKDAIMALKWVQENISRFSGDRHNITLAGHSSGALIAHNLMLSPMAKGLFHRIILQGGCGLSTWAYSSKEIKNIAKTIGFYSKDEKAILKFLCTVSVDKLIEAQEKLSNTSLISKAQLIAPIVESKSETLPCITQHPVDVIQSGNYNKVPMMIGYGSNEGLCSEFIYGERDFENFTDFQKCIPHYFNIPKNSELSKKVASKIQKFYFENSKSQEAKLNSFYMMQTDCLILLAQYYAINMHIKNLNNPIYFYRNSCDTNLNIIKQQNNLKMPGSCHGDELGYLFKNDYCKSFEKDSVEANCVKTVIKLWANFARNGDPNGEQSTNLIWKPVRPKTYNFLDINIKLTTGLNLDIERMKFWDEISCMNTYKSKFTNY